MVKGSGHKYKLLNPLGPKTNELFRSMFGDLVEIVGERNAITEEELIHDVKDEDPDFLLANVGMAEVTRNVIYAGNKLRAIVCTATGFDFVDLKAATQRGIFVTNAPTFAVTAVAEHSIGLMFAITRKIMDGYLAATSGNWSKREKLEGIELEDKTLGIIGIGRIGSQVASKAKGLAMNVIAYDPFLPEKVGSERAITMVNDLNALLRNSDIVSIHVPLTESTRHMISEKELRTMKKSAFVINCSRGAVMDEKVLERALREGWIAGAALDVLENEPPRMDNALLHLENVIVTPHIGFNTKEAKAKVGKELRESIISIINGEVPKNLVNREVVLQSDSNI